MVDQLEDVPRDDASEAGEDPKSKLQRPFRKLFPANLLHFHTFRTLKRVINGLPSTRLATKNRVRRRCWTRMVDQWPLTAYGT